MSMKQAACIFPGEDGCNWQPAYRGPKSASPYPTGCCRGSLLITQGNIWSVAGPPLPLLPKPHCSPTAVSLAILWGCIFWYHGPKQHLVPQFRWKRFSHLSEMLYKLLFNGHWLIFFAKLWLQLQVRDVTCLKELLFISSFMISSFCNTHVSHFSKSPICTNIKKKEKPNKV